MRKRAETTEKDRGENATHMHQAADSFLMSVILSLDGHNIHVILTYLLCHFVRTDQAQEHVHSACTARC